MLKFLVPVIISVLLPLIFNSDDDLYVSLFAPVSTIAVFPDIYIVLVPLYISDVIFVTVLSNVPPIVVSRLLPIVTVLFWATVSTKLLELSIVIFLVPVALISISLSEWILNKVAVFSNLVLGLPK